jgi:hypothetical protein
MKYMHGDKQDADPKLSRAINIQQKMTVPFAEKRNNKLQNANALAKENEQPADEQRGRSSHQHRKTDKGSRPSLTTSKSTPDEQIFMDKHKLRSRGVISRNVTRIKKAATFFEKENERGGSTAKLQRCRKMKTEGSLERSKTRIEVRARYDREPFVLSPWMFTEENIENSE